MKVATLLAVMSITAVPAFAQPIVGSVQRHTVTAGESLTSIAARYGLDVRGLAADNELAAGTPVRPGVELLVDNRHIVPAGTPDGVVLNVPQRMVFVFRDGAVVASYPAAVGRKDWQTPLGTYEIQTKEQNPTWDVPVSIQREMAQAGKPVVTKVAPGPANPLGDRWLGLTGIDCGLHGTNQPTSIYRFTTHGCIRLHPDDVAALFEIVTIGTSVTIVYEPVLAAVLESGAVMLEVHPDAYGKSGDLQRQAARVLESLGSAGAADAEIVRRVVRARAGRPVVVSGT